MAPTVFYSGDRQRNAIYLTMDDCWSTDEVARAMDVSEAGRARMTFFPIGTAVADSPAFWKTVVERGHAIENHTLDHAYLSKLTTAQIEAELVAQSDVVAAVVGGGYRPRFMRPPAGDGIFNYDPRLPEVATKLGLKIAMWSSDSNGWRVYPRTDQAAIDYVLANVFANFSPGTIVIQHALKVDTLALPAIVAEANRLGYTCLTIREGIA